MRRDGGFYTRTAWGYPQVADFTFYGGLYRDVNVICLPATHFGLSYYGGCGLHITPEADGRVQVESWVSRRFGFRSYKIDPDRGFFLNGQSYPLHGVSRHQDGWGVGNALTKKDHIRDLSLIHI